LLASILCCWRPCGCCTVVGISTISAYLLLRVSLMLLMQCSYCLCCCC
jgi:hypothetical protein